MRLGGAFHSAPDRSFGSSRSGSRRTLWPCRGQWHRLEPKCIRLRGSLLLFQLSDNDSVGEIDDRNEEEVEVKIGEILERSRHGERHQRYLYHPGQIVCPLQVCLVSGEGNDP